jgi:hypothetical protein
VAKPSFFSELPSKIVKCLGRLRLSEFFRVKFVVLNPDNIVEFHFLLFGLDVHFQIDGEPHVIGFYDDGKKKRKNEKTPNFFVVAHQITNFS